MTTVMDRRRFLVTSVAGAVAGSLDAEAQQAGKIWRIGFLGEGPSVSDPGRPLFAHIARLRELGYVEGQNLVIEYRWAAGKYERFPSLIADLLTSKVEVIVTAGTPASLAVKKATTSVPLVMVAVGDPVATGLIASLARPGPLPVCATNTW